MYKNNKFQIAMVSIVALLITSLACSVLSSTPIVSEPAATEPPVPAAQPRPWRGDGAGSTGGGAAQAGVRRRSEGDPAGGFA